MILLFLVILFMLSALLFIIIWMSILIDKTECLFLQNNVSWIKSEIKELNFLSKNNVIKKKKRFIFNLTP